MMSPCSTTVSTELAKSRPRSRLQRAKSAPTGAKANDSCAAAVASDAAPNLAATSVSGPVPSTGEAVSLAASDQAAELEALAVQIEESLEFLRLTFIERAVSIGRLLLTANALLAHKGPGGRFEKWLASRLDMYKGTCFRYMVAARFADTHPDIWTRFEFTAIQVLSRQPFAHVVPMAVDLARNGEAVSNDRLRRLLTEHASTLPPAIKKHAGKRWHASNATILAASRGILEADSAATAPVPGALGDRLGDALQRLRLVRDSWPDASRALFVAELRTFLSECWPEMAQPQDFD